MKVDLPASDLRTLITSLAAYGDTRPRREVLNRQLELAIADEHGCSITLNLELADDDGVVYGRAGYCRCGCLITADVEFVDRYAATHDDGRCGDDECLCHTGLPAAWYTAEEWANA